MALSSLQQQAGTAAHRQEQLRPDVLIVTQKQFYLSLQFIISVYLSFQSISSENHKFY